LQKPANTEAPNGPNSVTNGSKSATEPPRAIENDRVQNPRAALALALNEAARAALAGGDLHAARVAHEALGRLLADPEPGTPAVADLAAERAKRR
jgi:hypothetical protein